MRSCGDEARGRRHRHGPNGGVRPACAPRGTPGLSARVGATAIIARSPVHFTGKRLELRSPSRHSAPLAALPRSPRVALASPAARRSTPTRRRCARSASTSSTSTRATTSRRTWSTSSRSARPSRRCGSILGTPLIVSRLPRQPLGLRLRVHPAGARPRAPDSSPSISSTTSSRAGKATRCRNRSPSSTVAAALTAGEAAWSDPRSWWDSSSTSSRSK